MPIYKQTTEITNIDDIWTGVNKDIVEIYFGNKNVFTVWGEYEGTLPATLNANGSDVRQYQVWGNTGGVGDRTVQLFDNEAKNISNGYLDNAYIQQSDGAIVTSKNYYLSEYMAVEPNKTYTWVFSFISTGAVHYAPTVEFLDASKNRISVANHGSQILRFLFTTPADCAFVRASVYKITSDNSSLTLGSPETFVPFGYELDISTSDGTSTTTTPIYIGNNPLGEDEYVDYSEQKVYRYGDNIFDSNAKSGINGYINDRYLTNTGSLQTSSLWYVSEYMGVEFKKYKVVSGMSSTATIAEYDENKNFLASHAYTSGIKITFEVLPNCKYLRMSVYKSVENRTSLNALQPENPPVPLPALPTCEGTTVLDYAGQSVAPEKVILKYRKKNS